MANPWQEFYGEVEKLLEPVQPFVIVLCLAIIAITVWVLVQKDNSIRTAWVVYMLSP